MALFDDLLSAFGQDTMTTRYASWADVLDYCRRSANPVGRLVLRIAGYRDDALDRSSDALCTALQLTNFWQDFGRDWRAGRLYVPREVLDACGAREADLRRGSLTAGVDARARRVRRRHARALFDEGRARLRRRARPAALELRFTWLGGARILDRVDAHARSICCSTGRRSARRDVPALLWRAARWTGAAA